ncbi:LLM class flavin-dependent oxidoreductase [Siminovitchia sediminis]|uniref:LLM class flavin-dependent oxidoreductase n=1 Tax=Siminovitchia sediminis TaxID=1274353 RepID=A0ABW4KE01_9BACI
MTRPLSFSAFLMNTPNHNLHGLWREEEGYQRNFNDIDLWVSLAKRLDEGGFDSIFFADVVGLYGNHRGGWEYHIEKGLQVPSNDPSMLLSALAVNTKHLGLAFTASPLQEPPFNFARRISTLDHISNGRVAWNMTTGFLENAYRNYGYEGLASHEERYGTLDEYADVLYKLWEGSWDEGALLKDRESGIYADPAKVHKINHAGKYYKVEGPHLVSPSPQRTPVLFQAGSSPTGRDFAARNAEGIFIKAPSPEIARRQIEETRQLAVQHGRKAEDLRFYQGLSFVIGKTEEEAQRKAIELENKIDLEMMIAHMAGAAGMDLGNVSLDTPLENIDSKGVKSFIHWIKEYTEGRTPTVKDLALYHIRTIRIAGTPETIANQLEQWQKAGVDGINVISATIPGSYEEFIDYVMPVLRQRGLARNPGEVHGTFRQKLFGEDRLNDRHPAAQYRGAFGPSTKS